jgi:hypothetical protein
MSVVIIYNYSAAWKMTNPLQCKFSHFCGFCIKITSISGKNERTHYTKANISPKGSTKKVSLREAGILKFWGLPSV